MIFLLHLVFSNSKTLIHIIITSKLIYKYLLYYSATLIDSVASKSANAAKKEKITERIFISLIILKLIIIK